MESTNPNEEPLIPAADVVQDAADTCNQIAYQYTALIQPHACLLVLNTDMSVVQASQSAAEILGLPLEEFLQKNLATCVEIDSCETSVNDIAAEISLEPKILGGIKTKAGRELVGRLHVSEGNVLLELEPEEHTWDLVIDDWQAFLLRIARLGSSTDNVEAYCNLLVNEIRATICYERCMVYRFDKDWNGEVIAECRDDDAEDTFLGLWFPATDIPNSARRMFAESPVRATCDQFATFSPIEPRFNPTTGKDVDLSHVRVRGAAGSCQTYYRNMGLRSTLIMPIFVRRQLWGLIACHDCKPNRVSPRLDSCFELIGRYAASSIERCVLKHQTNADQRAIELHRMLMIESIDDPAWSSKLSNSISELREILQCSGFVLRCGEHFHTNGAVPDLRDVRKLIDTLLQESDGRPLAIHNIPIKYPEFAQLASTAAGAILVPLVGEESDAALWLRSESAEQVEWAGDPVSRLKWNAQGQPELTPRNSFKLWQSTTAGTCRGWTQYEETLAQSASMQIGLMYLTWRSSQASRAKTNFLTNMSHEIRTPMTAILGYAELLADEEDIKSAELLGDILRNGRQLQRIIDDILEISRMESDEATLDEVTFTPHAIIAETATWTKSQADKKNLSFTLAYLTPIPDQITSDPLRLRHILTKLLDNAVKFTEKGEISLRVRYDESRGVDPLLFEVSDTGVGLSGEQIADVFRPFQQVDNTLTREHGGAGLGLTICERLVQRMGGVLTVESAIGRGSTFTFSTAVGDVSGVNMWSPTQRVAGIPH